jgi:putative holliday junction resolvase
LAEYGRILGVDVGGKRIGLARTDLLKTFASPVGTFSPPDSIKEIQRHIVDEGPVLAIVVGWPLSPQGEPTDATQLTIDYINLLKKKFSGTKIYTMDERFSSREAQKLMAKTGVPKKKRQKKGRVDQAAAALILQQFLEAHPDI